MAALDDTRRTPEGAQRAAAAWGRARVKINAMQTTVASLGGGWRGDSVREAVESALDAEDITPLVRMAFDAPGKAAVEAAPRDEAEEDGEERAVEGRPAPQAAGTSAAAVLVMLQRVAEE
ncbi:hypothetical protein WJX81_005862, partial [Elliptochloris bilobata]